MKSQVFPLAPSRLLSFFIFLCCVAGAFDVPAQTLNVPARVPNAPTGTEFVNLITPLSLTDRENAIYEQIMNGNVPGWLKNMVLVTTNSVINGTNYTSSYYVTPDYLAIGSDTDYFLTPMTPLLGQRLADALNCSLPTRKMVNDIWRKAPCKLAPSSIPPSASMTTVPIFNQHNTTVRNQRYAVTNTFPLGTLVGGDKKDVVLSLRIYTNFASSFITKPVVIYGWHRTDGSNIQPLYNGHEETYADYSHGIRLVQMSMTVNGAPNSVTNILTNPGLASLLSDEGVLAKPYYTIPKRGPNIQVNPFSKRVQAGANVNFSVTASGIGTLRYQWTRNGSAVAGATNSILTFNNVSAGHAGTYGVSVSDNEGTTFAVPAWLRVSAVSNPLLFSDSFETNSSLRWTLQWGSGNGVQDHTVAWAFDYGSTTYTFNGRTNLIPPAPGSAGTTKGLKLKVNNNDATGAIAGVNLYAKDQAFSGNYSLKADMWMNYPGASGGTGAGVAGSTEHCLLGLNHTGLRANWAAASATATDGLWFAAAGEGGTARDYRAYVGNTSGTQNELIGPSSGLSESNNASGLFPTLFPSSRFESAGAPGKNWVEVELRQLNGTISWIVDGTVIAERTNASAFQSGTVMVGYMDLFPSIAAPTADAFVLFDNVRVEDLNGVANEAPAISIPPTDQNCQVGGEATFSVAATGSAPLIYRWYFEGDLIPSATAATLHLTSVQEADEGTYSVVVSNAFGVASASAELAVATTDLQFGEIAGGGGEPIELTLLGSQGESYVLEASTNLIDWVPATVFPQADGPLLFSDPQSLVLPRRFYRSYTSTGYILADFEGFAVGAGALFNRPVSSGSTSNFIANDGADFSYVTNQFPSGNISDQVIVCGWNFRGDTSNPWLRLTSFNAVNVPNPTISFQQALRFDVYSEKPIYVAVGLRETGTSSAIGENGGATGSIEWIGSTSTVPPRGKLVPAGEWATLQFVLPSEPVRAFTGNGVLASGNGKGVLEHLAIAPATSDLNQRIFLDNFRLVDLVP